MAKSVESKGKAKAATAVATPATASIAAPKPRPGYAELYATGKKLREKCARAAHAGWKPPRDRHDPLQLLLKSSEGRIPELLPLRYGRMLKSPFTFYRGAALNMAADLSGTPVNGLRVQVCGDAHLCNFGAFATPERRMIFDINDLDETLPAPWEWDVKRLAASFVVACRDDGFGRQVARDAVRACVRSYRERMLELGQMRALDVWYASVDFEKLIATMKDQVSKTKLLGRIEKARARSVVEHDFPQLTTIAGATPVIKDNPPLIFKPSLQREKGFAEVFRKAFLAYRDSLPEHRRVLLDRYQAYDIALKVVGVGSVGTACGVILMMAAEKDPLFLQVKQANASVLEAYAGKSRYANHGQRVVAGCQLMQSASDVFLGWTEGQAGRQFYVRQLKDMKITPMVETFTSQVMEMYAGLCGNVLANAHARTGEPAAISGYLGKSDAFDEAIADFSFAYADQNERDHAALMKAVRAGKIDVAVEEDR